MVQVYPIISPCLPNEPSPEYTYPETSLTISLTKAVFLLKWPLVLLTLGLTTRASVFYISHKVISPLSPSSDWNLRKLQKWRSSKRWDGLDEWVHTWPLLRPTARPVRSLRSAAIVDWWRRGCRALVVGRKSSWCPRWDLVAEILWITCCARVSERTPFSRLQICWYSSLIPNLTNYMRIFLLRRSKTFSIVPKSDGHNRNDINI